MIRALLRKDLLLHWPIGLAAMVLLTAQIALEGAGLEGVPEAVRVFLPIIAWVAAALLIVSVIQADAPAGTKHEWLTRAVPARVVIASKALFIIAAMLTPSLIGSAIAGIVSGLSWSETALIATAVPLDAIVFVLAGCVLAVLTATLLEAAIVGLTALAVMLFVVPLTQRLSGTGDEISSSGVSWIAEQPRVLFAITMCLVLIWLMYTRRRTFAARLLFGAAVTALVFSPALATWSALFAVQKALSAEPQQSDNVSLAIDGACMPAIFVNPSGGSRAGDDEPAWASGARPDRISSRQWTEAERRLAGANAVGFESRVLASGAPASWRVLVARAEAAYSSPSYELRVARYAPAPRTLDTSTELVSHYWLLPHADAERLAATPGELAIDYSLSLLKPAQTAELIVGAPRRFVEHFGHCGAQFDRATSAIKVECYERGARAAQLTANLAGASGDTETASGSPDYTPTVFELFGGRRQIIVLRNVPEDRAARVTLTNYEAVAHFTRVVKFDGVLGGSAAACPLPARRGETGS